MKKTEIIELAIAAVIDDKDYAVELKIKVLEWLYNERNTATYWEDREGEKANESL